MATIREYAFRTLGIAAALAVSQAAHSANIDTTKNLMCALIEVSGCEPGGGCTAGRASAFDLPDLIVIDFQKKEIRPADADRYPHTSPFTEVLSENGQLMTQGYENEHPWSLVVDQGSGDLSASIVGHHVSYSLFGRCAQI